MVQSSISHPRFIHHQREEINGFNVDLFEVDLDDETEKEKLKDYLCSKVGKMNLHQNIDQYLENIQSPNILPQFKEKLEENIKEITTPREPAQKWLSVQRSWITEFMSQLLLESEYNCIFSEPADKKINIDPVNLNDHVPGIDVTGIQLNDSNFKFVVCEVKSSGQSKIPSSTADGLKDDINKAYEDQNNRLSREILHYVQSLGNEPLDDDKLISALEFLITLLNKTSSRDELLNNVVFFPFFIRNNPEIIEKKNLNDFENFNLEEVKKTSLQGIIWSFNTEIDEFCDNIYQEVVNNG